jgi:hypothetical protein
MFIYKFYSVVAFNLMDIIYLGIIAIIIGIFQDIDNSLCGKYILNNKYNNEYKKEYKIIYRTLLVVLFFYLTTISNIKKCYLYSFVFLSGYFGTSVISLLFQLYLEANLENNIASKEISDNLNEIYKIVKIVKNS